MYDLVVINLTGVETMLVDPAVDRIATLKHIDILFGMLRSTCMHALQSLITESMSGPVPITDAGNYEVDMHVLKKYRKFPLAYRHQLVLKGFYSISQWENDMYKFSRQARARA